MPPAQVDISAKIGLDPSTLNTIISLPQTVQTVVDTAKQLLQSVHDGKQTGNPASALFGTLQALGSEAAAIR